MENKASLQERINKIFLRIRAVGADVTAMRTLMWKAVEDESTLTFRTAMLRAVLEAEIERSFSDNDDDD